MLKLKPITQSENQQDALAARVEFSENNGPCEMWKLPRIGYNPSMGPIFPTPDDLFSAAVAYFNWAENNPISYETDVRVGGAVQMVKVNKKRPFSMRAFRTFCGITAKMWNRLNELPEFDDVLEEIESIIYTQVFDHGMVGIFDGGMTSKVLGLTDKKEISGPDNGAIEVHSALSILRERLARPTE